MTTCIKTITLLDRQRRRLIREHASPDQVRAISGRISCEVRQLVLLNVEATERNRQYFPDTDPPNDGYAKV